MSIQYVLLENNLRGQPNTFVARVQSIGTIDMEQLVDEIVERGSTVGRADILSVLEDCFSAIERLLLLGWNVTTPVANFHLSIRGLFDSVTDGYDPARHQVQAGVTAGSRLRRVIRTRASVDKQGAVEPAPRPREYRDINSGTRNSTLTPGGMGRLAGELLKFDSTDPAQGVFFLAEDKSETRVEVVDRNTSGQISFLVPALAAGAYRLQVRTVLDSGQELRKGELKAVLTVS